LNINPPSGDFGSVKVGHSKSVTFTLSNSAEEGPPITFESPVAFRIPTTNPQIFGFAGTGATNCPVQLFPQKTCQLTVEFIPAARGVASCGGVSCTVTVFDNAANAPQAIPLSGSGK
jgi:hypothetical protein